MIDFVCVNSLSMTTYIKELNRIHYDIRPVLRIDYILSRGRIFMLFVIDESELPF